ncbi:Anther-specific protein BCP1-like [Caenorhabditis elegans]|uniref:Anther-specific protein BCP1-like n=1 Tax=Caenorhabditis elegans TaxID=6239 RepID=Q9TXY1_CAEEL|nr:Anther-specific protein BCP1-like [Caenorhabditis elegans]CCD70099.1 Anther-specific protein BCP1-like [Caenorhabditis elegans]|eukprot:NP_493819.1 MS Related Protein [Caenorhabditis elegans]
MRRQTAAIFVLLGLLAVFVVQGSTDDTDASEDTAESPAPDNANTVAPNVGAASTSTAKESATDPPPAGTPAPEKAAEAEAAEATVASFTPIYSTLAAFAIVLAHAL